MPLPRLRQRLLERYRAWRALGSSCAAAEDCRFGPRARVRGGVRDGRPGTVMIGAGSELQDGVILDGWGGTITVGQRVFFGPYAIVYGHGGVTIGDGALISMHCRIVSSNHEVPPLGVPLRSRPDVLKPTRVGSDVWLGAGVTVLGGVTIGDGCIVGAGAVVTSDLPDGAIALGVPARVTGRR